MVGASLAHPWARAKSALAVSVPRTGPSSDRPLQKVQRHATRPRASSSESELSEHIELELLLVEPQLVTGKSTPQQHQVPRTGLRALLSADMMEPDPRAVGRGHETRVATFYPLGAKAAESPARPRRRA